MNAIDLLEQQHREVEKLFKLIEDEEDGERKAELAAELADTLAAHATIEEQIFYPRTLSARTEDILREAVEEHLSAKRVLADILESRPSDEQFDAKIKVLKEQIEHHVEEEEEELFPAVKKLMKHQLEEMGAEMEAMFADLLQGRPSEDISAETSAPAPLE
jgi:hemerythrin superfamily protein